MRNILPLIFILLFFHYSCEKIENLPNEPHIDYNSFEIFDTIDLLGNEAKGGRLQFHFEDGDGDIGLHEPQDGNYDTTNIIFSLYRKIDGEMQPAPEDDRYHPSVYRIPFIEKEGQNKVLTGTIEITFMYLFYFPGDTIMYEFYILDRAANASNAVRTNEIIVSENAVY